MQTLRYLILTLVLLFATSVAQAQVVSSTFTSTTGTDWSVATNWSGNAIPNASGTAYFNALTNLLFGKTITLGAAGATVNVGALNFMGASGVQLTSTFTIGTAGQTMNFTSTGSSGILMTGGGILNLASNITAASGLYVQNASGALGVIRLSGTTNVTGTISFIVDATDSNITVAGSLLATALEKRGVGSLTLSNTAATIGAVTFSGGKMIIAGTVYIGDGNAGAPAIVNLINTAGYVEQIDLVTGGATRVPQVLGFGSADIVLGGTDGAALDAALNIVDTGFAAVLDENGAPLTDGSGNAVFMAPNLANAISGKGDVSILNSQINLAADMSHEGATYIDATGALYVNGGDQLSANAVHLVEGLLDLQGHDNRIAALDLNGGVVRIGGKDSAGAELTTGYLSGSGVIVINVDYSKMDPLDPLAAGVADKLTVENWATGSHGLLVNKIGGPAPKFGLSQLVFEVPAGDAGFALVLDENGTPASTSKASPNGKVTDGKYDYTLKLGADIKGIDPSQATNWFLTNVGLGDDPKAIFGIAGALYHGWFTQNDNIVKRMGQLRMLAQLEAVAEKKNVTPLQYCPEDGNAWLANVWVQSYGERINVDESATGLAFHQYLYGSDIGTDKAWRLDEENTFFAGVFGGFARAQQKFVSRASGDINGYYAGLYGTLINEKGWYGDLILKGAYLDSSFRTPNQTRGDYSRWAAGASLEAGKRVDFEKGWYIQPTAQVSHMHVFGSSYQTTGNEMDINNRSADIVRLRAGFYAGQTIELDAGAQSYLQPYFKLTGVEQISRGGRIFIDDEQGRPNFDGLRIEGAAGLIWQLNLYNQLYLEYNASYGKKYNQPWGVNAGYRHSF